MYVGYKIQYQTQISLFKHSHISTLGERNFHTQRRRMSDSDHTHALFYAKVSCDFKRENDFSLV